MNTETKTNVEEEAKPSVIEAAPESKETEDAEYLKLEATVEVLHGFLFDVLDDEELADGDIILFEDALKLALERYFLDTNDNDEVIPWTKDFCDELLTGMNEWMELINSDSKEEVIVAPLTPELDLFKKEFDMLLVQEYLRTKTFKQLQLEHGVYQSFNQAGTLFSLNYDMIEARESDPLSQECRGLILSTGASLLSQAVPGPLRPNYDDICPGETQIIAFPLKRFFNHGMGACGPINFNDPKLTCSKKEDGTLSIIFFDPIAMIWKMATRSCPEADIPLDNGMFTFRSLFEKALFETISLSFEEFTFALNKGITYIFELTSPMNRIVCSQSQYRITLLAARSLETLQELNIEQLPIAHLRVKTYPLSDINDILKFVADQDPLETEGVVVMDSNFNRIKIKNAGYVMLHKSRDGLVNDRAFLSLILNNKEDDVWSVLPEDFQKRILHLKQKLKELNWMVMGQYHQILDQMVNKGDRKEFALIVQKEDFWGTPMFKMFSGKCSNFKEFIESNRDVNGEFGHNFLDKMLLFLE